jgi:hypothetical protein
MFMLGPVLMRMLVPVVTCESADGGSARPSDESARQNRAPTEYANGRPSSRPDSTTCKSLSVTRLAKFKTIIITRHLIW